MGKLNKRAKAPLLPHQARPPAAIHVGVAVFDTGTSILAAWAKRVDSFQLHLHPSIPFIRRQGSTNLITQSAY